MIKSITINAKEWGVSTWLPVDGNEKAFEEASLKNCECSFDDGTVFNFNSIDTNAELTHFKTECYFAVNSVVGKKGFYGYDCVEVISIIVKGFVNVKSCNPNDNGKVFKVHIDDVEFIH